MKKVHLDSINDIKKLVNEAQKCKCSVLMKSGAYCVDAKSILGVLSLDLSKDVDIQVTSDDCASFFERISELLVK